MSRTLVVSQPMFLPWVGLFEQIRLADIFIHYDDVQLPQGRSFMSRVQIKTPSGIRWLTAPIDRITSGKLLNEINYSKEIDWRNKHIKTLCHAYAKAPFFSIFWALVFEIYSNPSNNLSSFNINAIQIIASWLGIRPKFIRSSDIAIGGDRTRRLVDLCKYTEADVYVTGLGALNYLDYDQFETAGISVRYMNYNLTQYSQINGAFTPYVSILDAIANCGHGASKLISSDSIYWKEYHVRQT